MRRKKSRHKQIALEFLSNISLDGNHGASGVSDETSSATKKTFFNNEEDMRMHYPRRPTSQQQPSVYPLTASCRNFGNVIGPADPRNRYVSSVAPLHDALDIGAQSTANDNSTQELLSSVEINAANALRYKSSVNSRGAVECKTLSGLLNASPCRRLLICSPGYPKSPVAIFSIIAYRRLSTTSTTKTSHSRTHRSVGSATTAPCDTDPSLLSPASPNQVVSNIFGSFPSGLDPSQLLSSFRPVGDEVKSFAQFLQPRHSTFHCGTSYVSPLGAIHPFIEPDSSEPRAPDGNSTLITSTDNTLKPLCRSGHPAALPNDCTPSHQPQLLSTFDPTCYSSKHSVPLGRYRSLSVTSCGGTICNGVCSAPPSILYPDPLVYYIPSLLDDPELFVLARRRVFPLPNYLTSVLAYMRPSEQKKTVNHQFSLRFPRIQLSLTKLHSLKASMVQVIINLSYDIWIAAHAHVLFEKLILKLFIDKSNRRVCAAASLLISAKLNDIKGMELTALIQELESHCRISRRDLLRAELDICLGLEFCLIPPESEILSHHFRICKRLDLTPPYPIPPPDSAAS